MKKGKISSIESMGLLDGPGVRTVVFMKYCPLRCIFCHNPETWANVTYTLYTSDELVNKILRYKEYYKNNGGVTFSGGEPLLQIEFLEDVCKKLKDNNIHICLDTCGVSNGDYNKVLDYIDIVLYDIKSIYEDKYEYITKFKMDKTNAFLKDIIAKNKDIWIRQVVIPGINDTYEYMDDLVSFIKNIKNVKKVELLPYTTLGVSKYKSLGLKYNLEGTLDMDKEICLKMNEYVNELLGLV